MNEQVGEALKVIATSMDKVIFDFGRGVLYGLWKLIYSIETSVFKSFDLLFTQNPIQSAIGKELYSLIFTLGISLLIVISGLMILMNIVSNKPVENKNVVWQLMISIAVLAITPTMISKISDVGLSASSLVLKDVSKTSSQNIYTEYFKDMEKSVEANTMTKIDNAVPIDKLMINTMASSNIIKEKPKVLKKNKKGVYVWETEKISNGKAPFIGLMEAYKYKVEWLPLYVTTILSIGVSVILLFKVTKKSLSCLYKSYFAPLWQSIKQGHLQAIDFIGDYKNDMLFIFLSIMSLYFFRTALVEVLKIQDIILKYAFLIALSVTAVNLANNILDKISGGTFRDEQAGASALVGGAVAYKATQKSVNMAKKMPALAKSAKNAGNQVAKGVGKVNNLHKQGQQKVQKAMHGEKSKKYANEALKNGDIGNMKNSPKGAPTSFKKALSDNIVNNSAPKRQMAMGNSLKGQQHTKPVSDLRGRQIDVPKPIAKPVQTTSVNTPVQNKAPNNVLSETAIKNKVNEQPYKKRGGK